MKPTLSKMKYAVAVLFSTALMTMNVSASEGTDAREHKTSKVSYDWHSNAQKKSSKSSDMSAKERKKMAIKIAQHGRGSYICSPSGFGRMSRCHKR